MDAQIFKVGLPIALVITMLITGFAYVIFKKTRQEANNNGS